MLLVLYGEGDSFGGIDVEVDSWIDKDRIHLKELGTRFEQDTAVGTRYN